MEDKASNTISIIGIPKTATMEQVIIKLRVNFLDCFARLLNHVHIIGHVCLLHNSVFLVLCFQILGAFADPSGAPMQGMKIKNVVPGKD